MKKEKKFEYQENQYIFPYHHIPYLDSENNVVNHRSLGWGFKYFTYLLRIKELVEEINPDSILDVGCGEGRFLGLLGNRIRKVGVDLSPRPIKFAQAFHPDIEFHCTDANQLKEEFDVVTAIEVLEHVPDEQVTNFLIILEKRIKESGKIIISVPTTVLPVSEKHYRHYTLEILEQQLENANINLEIKHVEYVYKSSYLLKLYSKLTQNKFWIIDIKPLRNFIWRLVKAKYSKATKENGEELVLILTKK
ncbi:class I SAM-dependent methyltransferase [Christiangramia portivictoriae]|uniref:class I SAM-dependent methyltransferase n=1 Tax=Christiangramia portivictoriae TaxID=326069 RepID=UPI00040BE105|nr:class I SAM-dependent methyltransferase [Christiangramia portivictoriae]